MPAPIVLFVAAEAGPFAKTGGLGDVVGSLPKELRQHGVDARVIIPKYSDIPNPLKAGMVFKAKCTVPVGWRQQYCGVDELVYQGVPFYFIDNEYYFKRSGFYGHYDDAERFAFFCRAVLEILPALDFIPDVLHCHDWQTGMVSLFLKAHYGHNPYYQNIRTLFTIHNLRYQGVFPKEILTDLLALDWKYFTPEGIEFNDKVNFMKGGVAFADLISTVCPTYAGEIQQWYFGEQLDGLLRSRGPDLSGIVNGIDYEVYNPAEDPWIAVKYDADTPERKQQNKTVLQERLGLPVNKNTPVMAIVSRLVGPKGLDLVECVLNELLAAEDIQLVVLGTGEHKYQHLFQHAAWLYPDKMSANIFFEEQLAHQIYAGADLFLMPSLYEPCGIGQLIAMRYGALPIVRETGGLRDTVIPYNQYTGAGNGFSFTQYNAHDMLFTIRLALGLFQDKARWDKLVQAAMQSDYSWRQSVQQYLRLYNMLKDKGANNGTHQQRTV
ncbi:MAG TPA: glycogen synthase GlgA [Negativicutes bacterium]|jgi:starch synthase